MIKIGIELPDENLIDVDFSAPERGNPGVGGSEYLFSFLAYELGKKNFDIYVYHYGQNKISDNLKDCQVADCIEMIHRCEQDGIEILIHQVGKFEQWYKDLEKTNIKAIAWAHVYLEYYELKLLRMCQNEKRVVFVGKEEYDAYIDDDVIEKSTYIYNMIPTNGCIKRQVGNKKLVTYVGSIVPAKGFHVLAEIWPKVIKAVPDAELIVIGNGKVYRRNAELGKYGLAQADYEESFINYLLDKDGNILPSVHFKGLVGPEKKEIFSQTKVGIANPTAVTETFCMSAVEMEYACIPVISKAKWGLLDTIKDGKTGFLFNSKTEFLKRLIYLLEHDEENEKMGINAHEFVKRSFGVDTIIPEWVSLLNQVHQEYPPAYCVVQNNWGNDLKWVRILLRSLRFNLGLRILPSFFDIKNALKKFIKKNSAEFI